MTLHEIGIIIGWIAVGESICIFVSRKRSVILLCQLLNDLLWMLNMLFLGNYTGMALNIVAAAREIVFFNREKSKWAASRAWLFVFMGITAVSPAVTWAGFVSLIPATGSMFADVGFYVKSPILMKIFTFPVQSCWLVYALLVGDLPCAVGASLILLSAVIGLIGEAIKKGKQNKEGQSLDDAEKLPDLGLSPQGKESR